MQTMFRAFIAVFFLFAPLSANANTLKDIRKVVVSGDATATAIVLKRTGEHLKRSAQETRRPVALPKVIMDVKVSGVVLGSDGRNSAKVSVALKAIAGGAVSGQSFTVNSFMPGAKGREAALAEAIAKRVALAYHLSPVKPGKTEAKRPGKGRKYTERKQPARSKHGYAARDNRPLVIPTEAALTVRSRSRPVERRGVETPCVVTQARACD
jgi:hypothetical protein